MSMNESRNQCVFFLHSAVSGKRLFLMIPDTFLCFFSALLSPPKWEKWLQVCIWKAAAAADRDDKSRVRVKVNSEVPNVAEIRNFFLLWLLNLICLFITSFTHKLGDIFKQIEWNSDQCLQFPKWKTKLQAGLLNCCASHLQEVLLVLVFLARVPVHLHSAAIVASGVKGGPLHQFTILVLRHCRSGCEAADASSCQQSQMSLRGKSTEFSHWFFFQKVSIIFWAT